MQGDPYCSHCGATFRWVDDEESREDEENDDGSLVSRLFQNMVDSGLSTDEKFDIFREYLYMPDYMLDEILESIHEEEKFYGCEFIMVNTATYPQIYIFLRQDNYRDTLIFNRCYVEYSPTRFNPEDRQFEFIYTKLYESPKFQSLLERLEREGLEFRDIYTSTTFYQIKDYMIATFEKGDSTKVYYEIDQDLNFKKL